MKVSEIESAVMALAPEERLRIADRIWDDIEPETESDAELISDLRARIESEVFDGPSLIAEARHRQG